MNIRIPGALGRPCRFAMNAWTVSICLLFIDLASNAGVVYSQQPSRPNIIFIVADDLGWNDVGWHNPEMKTPNLDSLAHAGVILNQSYVQYVCSPSRTAFMTGYYPYHAGLQHYVLWPMQPTAVPLRYTFLAQKLKALGYMTHAIGKWHLGMCNWLYSPTWRGFDTFQGFLHGGQDHYTHCWDNYKRTLPYAVNGFDFRNNTNIIIDKNGTYSAMAFSEYAVNIVNKHDTSKPLHIYLPFQDVHSPLQVPKRFEDMYAHINNKARRVFSGMVSALDEAVGNVTKALKAKGLFNNTLIVFTADNGGQIMAGGNNYPLRGNKYTFWEGGTRAAAFVSGAGLKRTGYTYDGMIHAVDWHPTLLAAAQGGSQLFDDEMDGINQWEAISEGSESRRSEFVYNIDDLAPGAAIRVGDYKLMTGWTGGQNSWYPPPTAAYSQPVQDSAGKLSSRKELSCVFESVYPEEDCMIDDWQEKSGTMSGNASNVFLFNVKEDPTEHVNLVDKLPHVRDKLMARLQYYKKSLTPANYPPDTPWANPKYFPPGDTWSPGWC